jgi:hypothetical protein
MHEVLKSGLVISAWSSRAPWSVRDERNLRLFEKDLAHIRVMK